MSKRKQIQTECPAKRTKTTLPWAWGRRGSPRSDTERGVLSGSPESGDSMIQRWPSLLTSSLGSSRKKNSWRASFPPHQKKFRANEPRRHNSDWESFLKKDADWSATVQHAARDAYLDYRWCPFQRGFGGFSFYQDPGNAKWISAF